MRVDDQERVLLSITDNGRGFDSESLDDEGGRGNIVLDLRNRLRRAGGDLTMECTNDRCTAATASLPYFRFIVE